MLSRNGVLQYVVGDVRLMQALKETSGKGPLKEFRINCHQRGVLFRVNNLAGGCYVSEITDPIRQLVDYVSVENDMQNVYGQRAIMCPMNVGETFYFGDGNVPSTISTITLIG